MAEIGTPDEVVVSPRIAAARVQREAAAIALKKAKELGQRGLAGADDIRAKERQRIADLTAANDKKNAQLNSRFMSDLSHQKPGVTPDSGNSPARPLQKPPASPLQRVSQGLSQAVVNIIRSR